MRKAICLFVLACASVAGAKSMFDQSQVERVMAYWSQPNRYQVGLPENWMKVGLWQPRLTVDGSTWLWNLMRAKGGGKTPPTTAPVGPKPEWDAWVLAKYKHDQYTSELAAAECNALIIPGFKPKSPPAIDAPGAIPEDLFQRLGNPPKFVSHVVPQAFEVKFEDGFSVTYSDQVAVRPQYAYFRFTEGVMAVGKRVREWDTSDLDAHFAEAGMTSSERKIMSAVSLLEGGFESVNTYDTGFVSVGLIQFASLKEGGGSLGRLLRKYKTEFAADFEKDFTAYGLEVNPEGVLTVIDPSTGAIVAGASANQAIIKDKRLIAVFQRAGTKSRKFRVCQLMVARDEYLPVNDFINVTIGGFNVPLRVGDFVKSEAGLATLMDRKVNTGTLDPLPTVLANVIRKNNCKTVEEVAKCERELVIGMKFRKDFLADGNLSQPK